MFRAAARDRRPMTTADSFRFSRHLHTMAFALAMLAAASLPAEARQRGPRLSKDLADRVNARLDAPASVIVSGSDRDVQTLATRYGARVRKSLRGGAVLDLTGGQLVALSQDPDVAHLSGDARVRRVMNDVA